MRSTLRLWVALLCVAAVSPLAAGELEETIAKHIEARGGLENWSKIRSMRMSGEYTAFSKVAPFTLTRARDDSYVLDTTMNDRVVVTGYDGETAWWDNHWFKEGAQRMTGLDAAVAKQDAHFVNPLFNWEELGMKAEFLGDTSMLASALTLLAFPAVALGISAALLELREWALTDDL